MSQKAVTDFFIFCPPKCGTTSLFHMLSQHPELSPCNTKEPHFFSIKYTNGLDWYNNLFEKNTLDLIAIGEESGRLEEMLLRITQMDEQEATYQIDSLVLLIEPILILILGTLIAFIVVAILLPIFQMNFLMQ